MPCFSMNQWVMSDTHSVRQLALTTCGHCTEPWPRWPTTRALCWWARHTSSAVEPEVSQFGGSSPGAPSRPTNGATVVTFPHYG